MSAFGAAASGIGLLTTGPAETYTSTQQPLYNSVARPISDKSIYDWTSVNLTNGKAWDNNNTYMVQLDQAIINTPTQTVVVTLGFFALQKPLFALVRAEKVDELKPVAELALAAAMVWLLLAYGSAHSSFIYDVF